MNIQTPGSACCRRCRNQLLLRRAGSLREAAAREPEPTLLRAAVWLEGRAQRSGDPALSLEAALHYLVLAEHPEVLAQTGLAERYLAKADAWLQRAAHAGTALPPEQPARLHS